MNDKKTIIQEIAMLCGAIRRCKEAGNSLWHEKHGERLQLIAKSLLPSGSGIDCGTKVDVDASNDDKVVLLVEFHHMDENGFYDGWTSHVITVTPAFRGVRLRISGKDRNQIKDYLHETYDYALTRPMPIEQEAASANLETK